jgi:hypothetical protein
MEQNNIILIVIIVLILLYCCERLLLFTRENFTDSNEVALLSNLKEIEGCKKSTKLNCGERYIVKNIHHETLTLKKSDYLEKIVKKLVDELNQKTDLRFKFTEFEHVTEQIFSDGATRYILDFFIHETENYYNKRLILDILVTGNTGIIKNINIGNGRKEEVDVMKVQNYNFDHKIIDDENLKFNNIIKGFGDTSLDFGTTDLKNTMEENRNFTKWVEHKKDDTYTKPWPCRDQGKWWDSDGVLETEIPSQKCKGINSSYTRTKQVGNFRPDHKNRNMDTENGWVFSNYLQLGSDLSILP